MKRRREARSCSPPPGGGSSRFTLAVSILLAVLAFGGVPGADAIFVRYRNVTSDYNAVALAFIGPQEFNVTAYAAIADPFSACSEQRVSLAGRIAIVDAIGCVQETKLRSVQRAGAVGVIIYFSDYSTDTTGWDTYFHDLSSRSDLRIPLLDIGYEFADVVSLVQSLPLDISNLPHDERVELTIFPGYNLWLPLWNGMLYFVMMNFFFPIWAFINVCLACWRFYCFIRGEGQGGCTWNLAQITMAVEIIANAERVVIGPTLFLLPVGVLDNLFGQLILSVSVPFSLVTTVLSIFFWKHASDKGFNMGRRVVPIALIITFLFILDVSFAILNGLSIANSIVVVARIGIETVCTVCLASTSIYYAIRQLRTLKNNSARSHQAKIDAMTRWFLGSAAFTLASLGFAPIALFGAVFYSPVGFTVFLFGILTCMLGTSTCLLCMYNPPPTTVFGHRFGTSSDGRRRTGTRGDGENTLVRVPTNFSTTDGVAGIGGGGKLVRTGTATAGTLTPTAAVAGTARKNRYTFTKIDSFMKTAEGTQLLGAGTNGGAGGGSGPNTPKGGGVPTLDFQRNNTLSSARGAPITGGAASARSARKMRPDLVLVPSPRAPGGGGAPGSARSDGTPSPGGGLNAPGSGGGPLSGGGGQPVPRSMIIAFRRRSKTEGTLQLEVAAVRANITAASAAAASASSGDAMPGGSATHRSAAAAAGNDFSALPLPAGGSYTPRLSARSSAGGGGSRPPTGGSDDDRPPVGTTPQNGPTPIKSILKKTSSAASGGTGISPLLGPVQPLPSAAAAGGGGGSTGIPLSRSTSTGWSKLPLHNVRPTALLRVETGGSGEFPSAGAVGGGGGSSRSPSPNATNPNFPLLGSSPGLILVPTPEHPLSAGSDDTPLVELHPLSAGSAAAPARSSDPQLQTQAGRKASLPPIASFASLLTHTQSSSSSTNTGGGGGGGGSAAGVSAGTTTVTAMSPPSSKYQLTTTSTDSNK